MKSQPRYFQSGNKKMPGTPPAQPATNIRTQTEWKISSHAHQNSEKDDANSEVPLPSTSAPRQIALKPHAFAAIAGISRPEIIRLGDCSGNCALRAAGFAVATSRAEDVPPNSLGMKLARIAPGWFRNGSGDPCLQSWRPDPPNPRTPHSGMNSCDYKANITHSFRMSEEPLRWNSS